MTHTLRSPVLFPLVASVLVIAAVLSGVCGDASFLPQKEERALVIDFDWPSGTPQALVEDRAIFLCRLLAKESGLQGVRALGGALPSIPQRYADPSWYPARLRIEASLSPSYTDTVDVFREHLLTLCQKAVPGIKAVIAPAPGPFDGLFNESIAGGSGRYRTILRLRPHGGVLPGLELSDLARGLRDMSEGIELFTIESAGDRVPVRLEAGDRVGMEDGIRNTILLRPDAGVLFAGSLIESKREDVEDVILRQDHKDREAGSLNAVKKRYTRDFLASASVSLVLLWLLVALWSASPVLSTGMVFFMFFCALAVVPLLAFFGFALDAGSITGAMTGMAWLSTCIPFALAKAEGSAEGRRCSSFPDGLPLLIPLIAGVTLALCAPEPVIQSAAIAFSGMLIAGWIGLCYLAVNCFPSLRFPSREDSGD